MTALEEIKKGATQEEIAAAWSAWQSRHGGKLGPGPAFVEAINAALALRLPTLESLQRENEAMRERLDIGPCGEDAIDVAESAADHLRHRAEAAQALTAKEPSDRMLIAGSLVDWKKYSDKKEAARDVWNVMHRNADGPALASREGDTHKPVAYVCAADMELLGKSSDGWDFSMSPKPRPDLGMNMALYAAPLTEASRDPVLWVSPVDLRAWQKAKAGEIWASSENLEGECIPLYTALASRGGNTMQSEIVEKCVKSAMLSVIKEHPIGHWNDDQVEKVARRAITEAAISAQVQDVAIPEGWQLVPVEPTAGMIEAAKSTTTAALTRSHANEIYRAMLAAAPEKQEGC